jgi:hypothetical protein
MWEMWGNHDKLPNLLPWKEKYAPALQKALRSTKGGLYLNPLLTEALEMGDDNGNRQIALTLLLNNTLALHMLNNGFSSGTCQILAVESLTVRQMRFARPWKC